MIFDVTFEESKQTFNVTFKEVEIIDNTRPVVIEPLEIIENGEYSTENIDGFNPVKVNVPLKYEEGYADGYQASQESITLQEKTATENGEVTADEGFTGMSKVTVAVPIKEEQEKTLFVTENGSYSVESEEGKSMSKVNVDVNVTFDGELGKPYVDTSKITNFSHFCVKNRFIEEEELDKLDTSNGTSFSSMFNGSTELETIPLLDTSKGTDFSSMFYACETLKTIPLLDTSNGTDFSNMFFRCMMLETIPLFDTSKGTNFRMMFNACETLKTIPLLDTSNGTDFGSMFYGCSMLKTIPQLDTSKGTNFGSMFYGCSMLETVSLTTAKSNLSSNTFQGCTALKNITIGEGWAVNIYLHYSNNLTVESLHGMIENLADLTGQTAKTFQIGATNLAKIDEEHINMLKAKNWNYS